jgi:hypothetical protein
MSTNHCDETAANVTQLREFGRRSRGLARCRPRASNSPVTRTDWKNGPAPPRGIVRASRPPVHRAPCGPARQIEMSPTASAAVSTGAFHVKHPRTTATSSTEAPTPQAICPAADQPSVVLHGLNGVPRADGAAQVGRSEGHARNAAPAGRAEGGRPARHPRHPRHSSRSSSTVTRTDWRNGPAPHPELLFAPRNPAGWITRHVGPPVRSRCHPLRQLRWST